MGVVTCINMSAGATPKPSKFLSARSRSSSIETPSGRPNSATAFYQGRRGTAPNVTKHGSTPSSGRSTPVHRTSTGSGTGKEGTDGGVVSTRSGLPPRTPYRYSHLACERPHPFLEDGQVREVSSPPGWHAPRQSRPANWPG